VNADKDISRSFQRQWIQQTHARLFADRAAFVKAANCLPIRSEVVDRLYKSLGKKRLSTMGSAKTGRYGGQPDLRRAGDVSD
jgi:hypothetical protein